MKNILKLYSLLSLFPIFVHSQVGIGTKEPKSTLDVSLSPLEENKPDGVLIPKISGNDLRVKSSLYNADQHGTMIYVTSADTKPEGKTIDVLTEGFFSYDHSQQKWIKLSGANMLWLTQKNSTTDPVQEPSTPNDNIFRMGRLAIGTDGITTINIPQNGGGTNVVTFPSTSDFDLRGNYNIRSGGNYSEDPTNGIWYLDQLASAENLSYINESLSKTSSRKIAITDPLVFDSQFLKNFETNIVGNKTARQSLNSYPSVKMSMFDEYDNIIVPFVSTFYPSINFQYRKSYSFTMQEPYNKLTRVWNFAPNIMNATSIGYAEGRINLQSVRIPETGVPIDDSSSSMSRIFIEKPYNHDNYISLENQNEVNNDTLHSNQIRLGKNGVTFFAETIDRTNSANSSDGSYTFPRQAPTNNQILYYGGNSSLEWKNLDINFDAGLATLPLTSNSLIDADTTGKAIVTKEYLEQKIPSPKTNMITVPAPPTDGQYTLVSEDGVISWKKVN